MQKETGQLVALTSTFSVELPGIEAAYNALDLQELMTGQRGSSWAFAMVDGGPKPF